MAVQTIQIPARRVRRLAARNFLGLAYRAFAVTRCGSMPRDLPAALIAFLDRDSGGAA